MRLVAAAALLFILPTAVAQTSGEAAWASTDLSAQDARAPPDPWPARDATNGAAAPAGLALALLLAPLYHRLDRRRVLDHPMRRRLIQVVHDTPGLTINALAVQMGVHHRTMRHHVEKLARFGILRIVVEGRRMRVAPADRHAPLSPGPSDRVLAAVSAAPGSHLASVARRASRSKSTVRWHLDRLAKQGLVRLQQDGGLVRAWPAASDADQA